MAALDPCADGSCSATPKQVKIQHDDDNEGISEEKANIRLLSLEKSSFAPPHPCYLSF